MSKRKSEEDKRREGRRALIILALASALFIASVVHFLRAEGVW